METGAEVGVLVRSLAVAVQEERTEVLALAVAAAYGENDTRSVVVAAVADVRTTVKAAIRSARIKSIFKSGNCAGVIPRCSPSCGCRSCSYLGSACCIGEVRRILDSVNIGCTEVDTIAPVVAVIPKSFDLSVLGSAVNCCTDTT